MTQRRQRMAIRRNRARSDGSLGTLKRTIARDYGLPEGSIVVVGPDGRPLRADVRVATLRKRYD